MTDSVDVLAETQWGEEEATPTKPRLDHVAYESDLIELLVLLDMMRSNLEGPKLRRTPAKAIVILQDMIRRVVKFAEDHGLYRKPDLQNKTNTFFELSQPLHDQFQTPAWRSMLGLATKNKLAPEAVQARDDSLRRCLQLAYDVILANFVLFTDYFGNSKLSREWVEVAAGFLAGFKRSSQEAFAS
jgi:hypothetical protein